MKTQEIIILLVLIFFILFFLNNNRNENYERLVIYPEQENSNQICFDKNKLYGNFVDNNSNIQYKQDTDNNSCMCTMDYSPVNCGGAVYSNFCHAKCAGEDTSRCTPEKNFIDFDFIPIEEININK
jgi:hypothetical protein